MSTRMTPRMVGTRISFEGRIETQAVIDLKLGIALYLRQSQSTNLHYLIQESLVRRTLDVMR